MKGKSRFDISFIAFFIMALVTGLVCYAKGKTVFSNGMDASYSMLIQVIPRMAAVFLLAGFVQVLIPKDLIVRWIGGRSGVKGILIASLAGALTPGGPMTSFPLLVALSRLGADNGSLVAYLTSWELFGIQRLLVWEIPLMGMKFVLLKSFVSLALPIIAGMISRKIFLLMGGPLQGDGG